MLLRNSCKFSTYPVAIEDFESQAVTLHKFLDFCQMYFNSHFILIICDLTSTAVTGVFQIPVDFLIYIIKCVQKIAYSVNRSRQFVVICEVDQSIKFQISCIVYPTTNGEGKGRGQNDPRAVEKKSLKHDNKINNLKRVPII